MVATSTTGPSINSTSIRQQHLSEPLKTNNYKHQQQSLFSFLFFLFLNTACKQQLYKQAIQQITTPLQKTTTNNSNNKLFLFFIFLLFSFCYIFVTYIYIYFFMILY